MWTWRFKKNIKNFVKLNLISRSIRITSISRRARNARIRTTSAKVKITFLEFIEMMIIIINPIQREIRTRKAIGLGITFCTLWITEIDNRGNKTVILIPP
jgi:hypothetical protein